MLTLCHKVHYVAKRRKPSLKQHIDVRRHFEISGLTTRARTLRARAASATEGGLASRSSVCDGLGHVLDKVASSVNNTLNPHRVEPTTRTCRSFSTVQRKAISIGAPNGAFPEKNVLNYAHMAPLHFRERCV